MTLRFTKTAEELAERRSKVSQWIRNGQVETTQTRTARTKAQKEAQELQDKADMILAGLQASTKPFGSRASVTTPKVTSKAIPGAVAPLASNVKNDRLAVEANKVLQEILNS